MKDSEQKNTKKAGWHCYYCFGVRAEPKEICSSVNERQSKLQLWKCVLWDSVRSLAANGVAHQIILTCPCLTYLLEHAEADSDNKEIPILILGNQRNLSVPFLRSSYMHLFHIQHNSGSLEDVCTCSQYHHKQKLATWPLLLKNFISLLLRDLWIMVTK